VSARIFWLTGVATLGLAMVWNQAYISHLLVIFSIYLLLAHSLNLVTGFGGLIVFCQAIFYGIGAYVYALTRLRLGTPGGQVAELFWCGDWSWGAGVLAGAAAGAALAWLVGRICLRFKGDYFIFATIGFQMIFFVALYNWVELGRGAFGIYGIPRPSVFGLTARQPWQYALLTGAAAALVIVLIMRLYRSPFGLMLSAMREDERATLAMGVNSKQQALKAMTLSGGMAGLAGTLYAGYATYIDPTSFSLQESIFIVTLLLLGGGGNAYGPLAGTAVMVALPEALRFVGLPDAIAANTREIIYGLMLAFLMYQRPQGLAGVRILRS
jgi:branched-chain amino acid transport system permease protein